MGLSNHTDVWTSTMPEYVGGFINTHKSIPTDYPDTNVEFSENFTEEEHSAIQEMEASLNTDDPIVAPYVEEGEFASNYVGTYNLEGEGGEHVLLSPERINTESAVALHYNEETSAWENIDNVVVENGYVYGDIESFSPVAVFEVKKDIILGKFVERWTGNELVCNGNPTKIMVNDNNEIIARNEVNGKEIKLVGNEVIIGGSVDGTVVKSANVTIIGVNAPQLGVCAGSMSVNVQTSIENAVVNIFDSKLRSVTGSTLMVRTKNLKINITNSELISHTGAGESQNTAVTTCVNNAVKDHLDLSAPFSTENVEFNFDGVKCFLPYVAGNCGNTYTKNVKFNIKNSNLSYALFCSSNGKTDNIEGTIENSKCQYFQTTNRGTIGSVKVDVKGCSINNLFVAGDSTDKTVTGVVNSVEINIDADTTGKLMAGTNGGVYLTTEEAQKIVKAVRYSRASQLVIEDKDKNILGSKLIKK